MPVQKVTGEISENDIIKYKDSEIGKIMINNPYSKPTEQECTDGLLQLQTDFDNAQTKKATDKTNANKKLKDLGLTDDEIKAIKGID